MQDPRERLFRDETGAALERASRLEDENRRLRAEIDRLRQGPAGGQGFGPPPFGSPYGEQTPELLTPRRSDDRVIAAVVLGMVTLFAGVTLAARPHTGHSCGARHSFALQANPGIAVAGTPIRTGAPAASDPCAEPFVITDGMGLAVKAECIHPGSTLAREPAPPAVRSLQAKPSCSPPYVVDSDGHRRYKLDCIR